MTSPTGLLADLAVGRPNWHLLSPFPTPDPDQVMVGAVRSFLANRLDPVAADDNRGLPHRFLADLRDSGYLRLQLPAADGGAGLSDYATFQVITEFMAESVAAGFVVATHNGIGLPALLPVLPPGQVRDLVRRRIADGALSGWADTEPGGAANRTPATTATAVDGGHLLRGHKVFISNGPVADELIVGAATPGTDDAGLFVVDTQSAGFRVLARQEVIGLRGLPLGALELDGVHIPAERTIVHPGRHWRDLPLLEPSSARGRMYLISAAALAIGRRCLDCQRDFVGRRSVDGVGLAGYPAVQKLMATSVADVYAMDTVVRWCLLGSDEANLTDRHLDRHAAKNVTSLACWRVVDRTMSLLAAEGAETAGSKHRRGARALPVEQLFRDARVLRITGGVDFNVALRGIRMALIRWYTEGGPTQQAAGQPMWAARLSARNRGHFAATTAGVRRFARTCETLTRRRREDLFADELVLIPLGHILHELFTLAVVLARAADDPDGQAVADVYCTQAHNRLAALWRNLHQSDPRLYQDVTTHWLATA